MLNGLLKLKEESISFKFKRKKRKSILNPKLQNRFKVSRENNQVSYQALSLPKDGITMNNKIETLIRQYKKEPDVEDQINILVLARQEIDQLHKTLAKTIR